MVSRKCPNIECYASGQKKLPDQNKILLVLNIYYAMHYAVNNIRTVIYEDKYIDSINFNSIPTEWPTIGKENLRFSY